MEESRESEVKAQVFSNPIAQPGSGEQSLVGSQKSSRRGSGFTEDKPRAEEYGSKDSPNGVIYSGEFDKSASSLESPSGEQGSDDRSGYMNAMENASGVRPRTEGREPFDNSRRGSLSFKDTAAIKKMREFKGQYYPTSRLHTTRSLPKLSANTPKYWARRWPRQLSFTAMVDVLAAGVDNDMTEQNSIAARENAHTALSLEKSLAVQVGGMRQRVEECERAIGPWVEQKVDDIQAYEERASSDQAKLDLIYHQRLDDYNALHDYSDDRMSQERSNLTEAVKELEILGAKLDYELSALESKVEDVESGVADFERKVVQVEAKAEELDDMGEVKVSWLGWFLRMVNM